MKHVCTHLITPGGMGLQTSSTVQSLESTFQFHSHDYIESKKDWQPQDAGGISLSLVYTISEKRTTPGTHVQHTPVTLSEDSAMSQLVPLSQLDPLNHARGLEIDPHAGYTVAPTNLHAASFNTASPTSPSSLITHPHTLALPSPEAGTVD